MVWRGPTAPGPLTGYTNPVHRRAFLRAAAALPVTVGVFGLPVVVEASEHGYGVPVRRYITTVSSRLPYDPPQDYEHPVEADIVADLEWFQGVMLLPGVLEEIRGHLSHWWGPGFVVERDPDDQTKAHVLFDGELEELARRTKKRGLKSRVEGVTWQVNKSW